MRVLVACECSGEIRRRFRARGHDAWSCDQKPAADGSPYHIQGDALVAIRAGSPTDGRPWDLVIAHPPCPRLALSGALRLYRDGKKTNGRDEAKFAEMRTAATFFRSFFDLHAGKLCVENPMQHGHAQRAHGMGPATQIIQPHQFGDDASKATCLWLRGLPPLMPSHIADDLFAAAPPRPRRVDGRARYANQTDSGQNKLPPSADRSAKRAVTYAGIAEAMAEQWG